MGNKLGKRFECFNCQTKFYDLGRDTAICPKCGSDQEQAMKPCGKEDRKTSKSKRGRVTHFDDFDSTANHDEEDPLKDSDVKIDLKAGLS